jgi:hypothetical protein
MLVLPVAAAGGDMKPAIFSIIRIASPTFMID